MISDIKIERENISKETDEIKKLLSDEDKVKSRINKLVEELELIEDKIAEEEKDVDLSKVRMDELKNLAERIETDLSNKKSFLNPLIEKSAQHKKKIEELQKSMLKNISKKKESVEKYTEESKHIIKNFEKFLNYKTNIEKKLAK